MRLGAGGPVSGSGRFGYPAELTCRTELIKIKRPRRHLTTATSLNPNLNTKFMALIKRHVNRFFRIIEFKKELIFLNVVTYKFCKLSKFRLMKYLRVKSPAWCYCDLFPIANPFSEHLIF